MKNIPFFLLSVVCLAGCNTQPKISEVVDNFHEKKAQFAMIAALSCEIGANSQQDSYQIDDNSQQETDLLDLAETVNIEAIQYKNIAGKCTLTLPVWEDGDSQEISYRYNIKPENLFDEDSKNYGVLHQRAGDMDTLEVVYNRKLSKRWFVGVTLPGKG